MKTKMLKIALVSLFFLAFAGIAAAQQYNISTYKRIDAYWNEAKQEYVITNEEENATLFEFNEKMTMFKHTTASISSTYYVKSNNYNAEKERYEMEIISDVGNTYTLVLDIANKSLRFLYAKSGEVYVVQHNIKSAWKSNN